MNNTSTTNFIDPANLSEKHFGFWGNLPLSRKLLIVFGVLFLFALVIAVTTLWGLNRVQTAYKDALAQGIEIRTTSDHLTISLLTARGNGKDYLLRWQSVGYAAAYENYLAPYIRDVAAMREYREQLAPFGPVVEAVTGDYTQAQYDADTSALSQNIDAYEQSFLALVDATKKRGYDENTGLEAEIRAAARNIEAKISNQTGLEQLEITLLNLSHAENNYLERQDEQSIDEVHKLISKLKVQVAKTEQIEPATQAELRTQMDIYLKTFDAIIEADKEIAADDIDLTNAANALESSIAKFNTLGEQIAEAKIAAAEANSAQITTVSITIVAFALGLSILLAATLSRQLTRPIILLTNTAQEISSGKFDKRAEVNSADEIGTLAQTFNVMTVRLGQAFEDVRRRALAVQTSAEVSRRLSVATNPHQLAADVVEQVQSAFNYYHAHIYFFDDARENLVMAGGTGEAGAAMLASEHKIPKGHGLVGRATETNTPVLVQDVTQAEGWLPNPLLPDTKSEIAIPIASGNIVLGVLDVQQNMVNGLDEDDVSLLELLAGQVAISLQNAHSFEKSKSQAELESLINTIGQKIQRATTVEDTLQTAIREVGMALGASRVSANVQANRTDGGDLLSRN